jgi:hypothetical protein
MAVTLKGEHVNDIQKDNYCVRVGLLNDFAIEDELLQLSLRSLNIFHDLLTHVLHRIVVHNGSTLLITIIDDGSHDGGF